MKRHEPWCSISPRPKVLYSGLSCLGGALFGLLTLSLQSGLSSSQSCDRHSERRAAHVVQADAFADLNGGWIATMFAANAHLHVWPGAATPLDCHGDELTNTIWIKADKGILLHDALGLGRIRVKFMNQNCIHSTLIDHHILIL